MTMELSGLNVDFASLAVEMQEKLANESDILSVGFPDQTIVLLSNTLAGGLAMLNYSQLTANLNNFLPFAFLKTAGYAISATLGVAPRRKTAAQVQARLRPPNNAVNYADQLGGVATIPAYSRFRIGTDTWHTRQAYALRPTDAFLDILLFQGEVVVEQFTGLGEKYQRWYVGSQFNVDNNTVRVVIDGTPWQEGESSFVYYNQAAPVFLQQTAPDGRVLVFFGNGIYGQVPPRASNIQIYYTVTTGFAGNFSSIGDGVDILDPVLVGPNQNLLIDGITLTPAIGGQDEHSLDDIKYVTPRLYAANHRAVRRDDYIGHLLGPNVPIVFSDARVWGEYEQAAKEGVGKLTMMNRAFWTGVLPTLTYTFMEAVAYSINTGQATFAFILPPVVQSVLPGSVQVTNSSDAIVFSDIEGNGVLVSPDVSYNMLTGGRVLAQNTSGDSDITRLNDPNIDSYWQSLSPPGAGAAVRIMYDWGPNNGHIAKSFRLRAANVASRELRAAPRVVSIWGTNVYSPRLDRDDDWTPIRGRVTLPDPGIAGFTDWLTLDNGVAYQCIMVKIEDRYGSSSWVRVAEWQLQTAETSSAIDYDALALTVTHPTVLAPGTALSVSAYGPDLNDTQQLEILSFLNGGGGYKGLNHFTTNVTYKPPIMRRVVVELEVYYFSEYPEDVVFSKVETAIRNLFVLKLGSIGRKITHADLIRPVVELTEVDYAVFLNPPFGSDILIGLGEFIYLDDVRLSMYVTERSDT